MLEDLTSKTVFVTGGGSGIGTGIATMMAAPGASVAVADLNEEWANKVAGEIGGSAIAIQLDVTDRASIDAAIERVVSEWGTLDILLNNAGVGGAPDYSLDTDREEDWDATFSINVRGVVPLGRPQTPEDIGKMAAFLSSEDARNVTGQCIHVDGGVVIND